MNSQTILIVPTWVSTVIQFLERNWIAMVGITVIALLASIVTWAAKHHFSAKYEEDKVRSIIKWVLVAVSAGFTLLGSLIYFVSTNQLALKKIPYIGQNEVEVLGTMWTLYQFRLNKTFEKWEAKLASLANAKLKSVNTLADSLTPPVDFPQPPPTEFTIQK